MKSSSLSAAVIFLCISVVCSREGSAADITLFTGFQNPGKLTVDNVTRDPRVGGVFGARFSGGQLIGFEQTLSYSPNFLVSGQHAFTTHSNLHVGIPAGKIVPYATAGIGLVTTFGSPSSDWSDFGTKFAVNYGGGVKFRNLAGPLGFRLDVRGYSVPSVFNQTLNFIEGSIGVLFSF